MMATLQTLQPRLRQLKLSGMLDGGPLGDRHAPLPRWKRRVPDRSIRSTSCSGCWRTRSVVAKPKP
jgi:hypothetical protein